MNDAEKGQSPINSAYLEGAILDSDIDKVEEAIKSGLNLNKKLAYQTEESYLDHAIGRAGDSLGQDRSDKKTTLQIMALLLQNGARVNSPGKFGLTPLRWVVSPNIPKLEIIDLLLKFGAVIDENIIKVASGKKNFNQLLELFSYHTILRERAQTNPDIELLKKALEAENYFVIDLILTTKPELRNDLDSIINQSSIHFQDLVYEQGRLPAEILVHIDKFASKKLVDLKNNIKKFSVFRALNNS